MLRTHCPDESRARPRRPAQVRSLQEHLFQVRMVFIHGFLGDTAATMDIFSKAKEVHRLD